MSLSLLVPEEKKLPISINFQKNRLSPVYMSIQLYTEIREFQDFTVERP